MLLHRFPPFCGYTFGVIVWFDAFMLLYRYLDDKDVTTPLILVDRPGSGLSSVLSTWIRSYLSKPHNHILDDVIPQYGSCMSRVLVLTDAWPNPRRRLILYLNLEFLWHRLDMPSLLYYILYTLKKCCPSFFMNELPDPNTSDMTQDFARWLEAVQDEQVVLIFDGMEHLRARTEDPICWIPPIINQNVRIVATTFPIGRVICACDREERKWMILRRRSELVLHERECIIHQALVSYGVGMLKEWLTPVIKSDRAAYQLPLRTIIKVSHTCMYVQHLSFMELTIHHTNRHWLMDVLILVYLPDCMRVSQQDMSN